MPSSIDIDFDDVSLPRHVVTNFAQAPAGRRRPKRIELLDTQPNLPLFANPFPPLEGERADRAFLAQANLKAAGAERQISLRDGVVRKFLRSGGSRFNRNFRSISRVDGFFDALMARRVLSL